MVGIFSRKKPYKLSVVWVDKLYQRRLKLIKLLEHYETKKIKRTN
jgi:hypothetical protein